MNDDLLRRAAESLRASTDGSSDRAAETRARLLAGAKRGRKRRSRLVVVLIPIAAALAASGAWAAATGRMAAVWHVLDRTDHSEQLVQQPVEKRGAKLAVSVEAKAPDPIEAKQDPPELAEPSAPAPPEVKDVRTPTLSPVQHAPHGAEQAASIEGSSTHPIPSPADADHVAYVAAHRAHFGGLSPSSALDGWDSYLKAFPSGRFSLEARYNRALCLVKLGRTAEASQALAPFARGSYGSYRQAEAKALLDAMAGSH